MKALKITLVIGFCILSIINSDAKHNYFIDISKIDHTKKTLEYNLIYFHFETCPPCKKMDKEVLNQESIKSFLTSNFNCYSVFGFDALEKDYRKKYNVNSNPCFIITDAEGDEIHRFTGYYPTENFITECSKYKTNESTSALDVQYQNSENSSSFLAKYVEANHNASTLDSALIFEFFESLDDTEFNQRKHFEMLLQYGFYYGDIFVNSNSRYHQILTSALEKNLFPEYDESIRNRLLFILHSDYFSEANNKKEILAHMRKLETGNVIAIDDIKNGAKYAMFFEKYPSFYLDYEQHKESGKIFPLEQLHQHISRVSQDHHELNSLAWSIYKDALDFDDAIGLEIIQKALAIEIQYNYLDTYAALLYKVGRFEESKIQVEKAIERAKYEKRDFSSTLEILEWIAARE